MNNTKVKSPLQFKKVIALLMTLFIFVTSVNGITLTASAASDGFYVSGTAICDANGNAFKMRGVNIAHAWYTSYTEISIKAAAALGANTVRVVLSDGQIYSKTTYSEVESIIKLCKENNLVCVLEVHDATGSDSTSYLDNAVKYWVEMKQLLNDNKKYVILNIANEWYGTWNGSAWADGYKSAIKSLRSAGIKNMLMVDCAGWGQYPDSILYYGKEVFNADPQSNTVFSIHMYEYAGGSSSIVKNNIDNALSTGVPVVIGEFGGRHTNGDVDEYTIMSYCEQKGVGYLGWSWKGNSSGLDYLDISNTWDGSSLTEWGNTLFNDSNGIKKTSSVCSVYGGSDNSGNNGSDDSDNNSGSDNSDNTSGSDNSDNSSSDDNSEQPTQPDYISLFYGSSSSSGWGQAVSVGTTKSGGDFDASNIKAGGHFYVEYKGTQNKVELILQSYSGGASWAKVQPSETGTANGNFFAKYSYDNCVAAFGSNFTSDLDRIHVGAMSEYIEVISLCYDFGTGSDNSDNNNGSDDSDNNNGSDDSDDNNGSDNSGNNGSDNSDNTSGSDNSDNSSSDDNSEQPTQPDYISLFYGSSSSSNWGQAVSVGTTKSGGDFDASNIKAGGHFYVEYKGTDGKVELILQSYSGGASWAKVQPSETGTANGNFFAKYSYDNCVAVFGSNFKRDLDKIHVGAMSEYIEVISVCYDFGTGSDNSDNTSGSDNSDNSSSNDNSEQPTQSDYISLFYGSSSSSGWGQAVSVGTTKAGGDFDASNIKVGGHFYVEYKGTQNKVELILQSYSGGASWAKVQPNETGTANGHYFAKYSYDKCVAVFGSNFKSYLDKIHVGAMSEYIEVISLCYDFGK